ncbi:MAG: ribonuclease D, partial [Lysobacterales bacterium]
AAFAGLGPGIGYQGLVHELTGTLLDKQETRSNWLARPLSARQIDYALDDVRYLDALHAALDARLSERGYRDWHREDCRRLAQAGWQAEPDLQPQRSFRNAWRWPLAAQAQLRRMLLWREQAARERDLPRRWVIDDETLATAAMDPAHSGARLVARLDAGAPGRRRALQPLLNLLAKPLTDAEIQATEAITDPRDPAVRAVGKRLRAQVQAQAERLDLPPGLLCPRRAIEALAETGQWPEELEGWRRTVLEESLISKL